jgi:multiple sugar transport system substrate-binding protein
VLRFSHDKPELNQQIAAESTAVSDATGVGWTTDVQQSPASYASHIDQVIGTKDAPDLFSWWSGWPLWQLQAKGVLDDLSDIWNPVRSQYLRGLDARILGLKNRIGGVPLAFSFWLTYYNTRVFSRLGLKPPASWTEMQQVMDTLRRNGVAPLGATYDGWQTTVYFQTLLAHSDPSIYNGLELADAKFTDPPIVEVMNLWADLLRGGNFNPPGTDPVQEFQQGRVGMLQMGTWIEPTLVSAGLQLDRDFSAFVWPQVKPDAQTFVEMELAVVGVPAAGSRRQQARDALRWFLTKEAQHGWVKSARLTSPRPDVPSWSEIDVRIAKRVDSERLGLLARLWDGMPQELAEFVATQFASFMRDPGNPQAVLQSIQAKADEVWPKVAASLGR